VRSLRHLSHARQLRRRDREQRIVHQEVRGESRPRSRPVADADVRAGIVEAHERSRGLEVQLHVRMSRGEARQARNEPAIRERVQRRYPNSGNFLVVAQQRAGYCVEVGQRDVGRIGQRAALGRQLYSAGMPLKQRDTECRFQPPYVMADSARSEVQLLRGVREVLVARGGREHCEGRQYGGADRHESRAIFVTGASSMRLQTARLQRKCPSQQLDLWH